jgi:hypothetical protein
MSRSTVDYMMSISSRNLVGDVKMMFCVPQFPPVTEGGVYTNRYNLHRTGAVIFPTMNIDNMFFTTPVHIMCPTPVPGVYHLKSHVITIE